MPESSYFADDSIPRDPVTIGPWLPQWANPGLLLHGNQTRVGTRRQCHVHDTEWRGDDDCWMCP